MIIGIPEETHQQEHRVGLNPFAVARLVRERHTVLIESHAGDGARFSDVDYQRVGAQVVYGPEEIYRRAGLVCRVNGVAVDELDLPTPGTVLCAFQHLAVTPRRVVDRLMELQMTLVGYEIISDRDGDLPVLHPLSEIAGQMAVHTAAWYLQNNSRGRGVLLGNVPGVAPPTLLILGAGTVGRAAARQARANGAHVIVLDADLRKLQTLSADLGGPGGHRGRRRGPARKVHRHRRRGDRGDPHPRGARAVPGHPKPWSER